MDRLVPLIAVLLALGVTVPASAQVRALRFTLKPGSVHTAVLKHTPNMFLRYVLVNDNSLLLGDQINRNEAYMYGYGVMLRFWQRGSTSYIRAVSLAPNAKHVLISYRA